MRRWLALLAYTALLYGLLPFGPALGRAVQATAIGRATLGAGAIALLALGVAIVAMRLRRRRAPGWAWAAALAAVAGYAVGLFCLRAIRLERVHLPEYGIAAWLAWRAIVPIRGARASTYALSALLAALIGWGDELVQAITPGRFYDLRDVAANAAGATLGALVLAVWHAGNEPPS
jgi:VanZ like family